MGGSGGNSSFEERLLAARRKRGLLPPEAPPASGPAPIPTGGEWSLAIRVGTDMVAALAVGVFIGWALDRWLGTSPAFLVVFTLLGAAAGIRGVWRLVAGGSAGFGSPPTE